MKNWIKLQILKLFGWYYIIVPRNVFADPILNKYPLFWKGKLFWGTPLKTLDKAWNIHFNNLKYDE